MSAGPFPFDPARLAVLAAWSREHTGRTRLPPIAAPLVVDDHGIVWLPAPDGSGSLIGSYVHAGLRMGWAPVPDLGGLLLVQWGGSASEPGFEEEGVTTFFSRDGLRRLIADLQSIDDQLEQPA